MPLRCLDSTGRSIHSFDLPHDRWQALELENRKARHLRMPCCSSQVILKRSRLGTPFFAHKALGTCTTAAETEEHLRLKRFAVVAARANGWTAETEVTGTTPSGEQWKADVLAQKGVHKVVVEVQWSGQTNEETMRRQKRYAQADIRCLWLLRQPGFPVTQDLPAARIDGSLEQGFFAIIPTGSGHQSVPMQEFLDAAFSKRLRFGVPLSFAATVSIRAGYTECWHRACGARTRIITGIDVAFGPNECKFSISEIGEHPELLGIVRSRLPEDLGIGTIKRRFSKTQERSYVSNGCVRCDRLFGEHFEIDARFDEDTICVFPIRISQQWQHAIESHYDYQKAWSVYLSAD